MAVTIGLAGKGGTGKTTIAGFLIRYLVEHGKRPVLGVDADPNANLNEVLGLEVEETLGEAREEMKRGVSSGMTKDVYMEMKLQQAVVEATGFDLVVMGRPEGAGCYCAANTLLTEYLDRLISNYEYVVIDNEAGMEHISRLTTNNIDTLLVISDPTRRGIQAANRIVGLVDELILDIRRKLLIVNQAAEGKREAIEEVVDRYGYGMELHGIVPRDRSLEEFDLKGRPTIELGKESIALNASYTIFKNLFGS